MTKDLKNRTKIFAHNCIKLISKLPNDYLANHIKKQLIRSSTSVAANYRATCVAQSKKAFISKISIVIEEIDESLFWIEFIQEENLLSPDMCKSLLKEADELTRIFISSRKTANLNIKH
ncbi:four helix bundle protein [Winogradskyella immobilis]|uniref:Four helix bundle protein n=1 Tax=Winogradskyella immobilis TaxID=2816852 RepID=A0ABS8ENZ2_9FLAO|nr:four helix bundle protein [Winogradskyella immobilis]MCC1484945.1 four helix bundle protein [Winogradskyella immobilis]MCG0017037.1 four helix bundle protein [Winogradskyella immobilis]